MNDKEDTLGETAEKLWQLVTSLFRRSNAHKVHTYKNDLTEIVGLTDPATAPLPPPKKSNSVNSVNSFVSVNGHRYYGRSVTVNNGQVIIDGQNLSHELRNDKVITIDISGDIEMLTVDACEYIKINGNASKVETMSGNVNCGDVTGDVSTMSGPVTCGNIGGDVETMSGSIRRR